MQMIGFEVSKEGDYYINSFFPAAAHTLGAKNQN